MKRTSKEADIRKTVLSTIIAYQEERGWTEYQLSERSGLPQTTISGIEKIWFQPFLL